MGERNQAVQQESESRKLAMLKNALYCAPAGAMLGAYAANELYPPTVEITPELSVEASLATGDGAIIPTGPPGELNFPHMVPDLPGPWNAVKLDASNPNNIQIPKNLEAWVNEYGVGLFTQTDSSIVEPIREALVHRLLTGAGIGAVVAGVAGALAFDYVRLRRKENRGQAGPEASDAHKDPKPLRRWQRAVKPLTALALTGALAGGLAHHAQSAKPDPGAVPLPAELAGLNPALEGATIRGPLQKLPSTLVDAFVEAKQEADRSFASSAENFTEAYETFIRNNRRYRELRANPTIRSLLHGSDLHCNFAYADNLFGKIIDTIQPAIFMNTGDTQTYSGTIPLENGCFPALLGQLGNVPMVNVNGNHDKKTAVDGTTTLNKENDYHANVDGIDFVGDDDPESTSWNSTKEDEKNGIDQESIKRGKHIADKACEITGETGVKPVALAHRWQMLAEAVTRGCIVIGNSGHLHKEEGIQAYRGEDGATIFQHTGGSATGTGTTVSYFYNKPSEPGYLMEQLYDQATNTFVGFVTYTFHTNGTVSISFEKPPKASINTFPTKMSGYVERQVEDSQDRASVEINPAP